MSNSYLNEHYSFLTKAGKYPGIDLSRFLAVISVILFHKNVTGMRFGFLGVDLFFTISGFLIGGLIIDELNQSNNFSFKKFYKNRFLRIYSTYLFFVTLNIATNVSVENIFADPSLSARSIFASLTLTHTTLSYYLFNYDFTVDQRFGVGGSWSLVIEEHFYTIIPFILFLLWRIGGVLAITIFTTILFLSGIFVRIYATYSFPPNDYN